jgi:L-alanine-DL-glutamate epimerase-like enolase superfamily enzyme
MPQPAAFAHQDVQITDVTLTIFRWTDLPPVTYTRNSTGGDGESRLGLVTISTDAGIDGHAFLGASFRPVDIDARGFIDNLKPLVMGENPLDRDRLHAALMTQNRSVMFRPIGAIDVALWDLAGKIAGLPIHRLLGTRRSSIPAYASSSTLATIEDYEEQALASKAAGYRAYKMHPPKDRSLHVPMLERVRAAVGDDFPLMYDPAAIYSYAEALKIGRVLERLGYVWFEDPLPVDDLYGYSKLCADLDIPVMSTEYSWGGFLGYPAWITARATDALRGDVALKGGITGVMKSIHLAEAFNMKYELHHGGNSLNNIANAHVAVATANCDYFEVILPDVVQKYAVLNELALDEKGHIRPPDGPGLGAEIDFDLIRAMTVEVLR